MKKSIGRKIWRLVFTFYGFVGHHILFFILCRMYDPDTHSALSADKVDNYLRHIQLPHRYWPQQSPSLNLDLLSALQAYHLSKIPYENLALHYTKDVNISLNVNDIYHKFVDKQRGGYCMENNIFFYHVLRFFGFQVFLTGARLHRTGDGNPTGWTGWWEPINNEQQEKKFANARVYTE